MAVTTAEFLRPDGLTVTISQVPGVSPAGTEGGVARRWRPSPCPGRTTLLLRFLRCQLWGLPFSSRPEVAQPTVVPLTPKGHS